MPIKREIAGYILAGGKNTRMAGRKKLFLTYQGKQFYEWMKEGLCELDKIYVSVEDKSLYESIEVELIEDQYGAVGPMGGILSGLYACSEQALLVIPCDMIPFPAKLIAFVLGIYETEGLPLVIRKNGRLAMFPGVYTKQMIPSMERYINRGQYRMGQVWEDMKDQYTIIDADEFQMSNINSIEEYALLTD